MPPTVEPNGSLHHNDVTEEDIITEQLYNCIFKTLALCGMKESFIGPFFQRLKLGLTVLIKFLVRIVLGIEIIWYVIYKLFHQPNN
jgi:hypothetical protein